MKQLLVLVAALGLAACTEPAPADAALLIQAVAGPTCPVERPGDPSCQPRPVPGAPIRVLPVDGRAIEPVAGRTDGNGTLRLELPAGEYRVTAGAVEGLMVGPEDQVASLRSGRTTSMVLAYDTGIR